MRTGKSFGSIATLTLLACASVGAANAQSPNMTFFVSSVGSGKGGDFGGLAGADKLCQTLAAAVGAGGKTWHAYMSTQGPGAVNAKDRIGKGPWQNAKGVVIAKDVAELHGTNNVNKETALTEKGAVVPGSGDTPTQHDILTGSQGDGTAYAAGDDKTCRNWTSSTDGAAVAGHHDRKGTSPPPFNASWNSSHPTAGCSVEALPKTGSAGLIYCFAAN